MVIKSIGEKMIKYNDGKIERATLEIEPSNVDEQAALKEFANLSPKQRAELVLIGFEKLSKLYQHNADAVSG